MKNALRFVIATSEERAYARELRASGLFDRAFYTGTLPRLHRLYKMDPERHYVIYGEPLGLRPNGAFSPAAYLKHNPDVARARERPFRHYIRSGRHECRVTCDLASAEIEAGAEFPVLRVDPERPKARFAVVVHLFYIEMWEEIAAHLARQRFAFDLFVSYVKLKSHETDPRDLVLARFPEATVHAVPNHGRDIYPFLHFANAGLLDGYEAICKLHTKKSPHRVDGDTWRQALISGILGDPVRTRRRLERFVRAMDTGFWVADGQRFGGAQWWGSNVERTRSLLDRIEVPMDVRTLAFPAGSIYWLKPTVLRLLKGLELGPADFEPEAQQLDGTTAHAVERALGYMCRAAGLSILQASELDTQEIAPPPPRPAFVTAFYLPQFHPVAENDLWWGKGFTEWSGVARGRPNFRGHRQPVLPTDLGFYDLRVTEVMAEQARMAASAGIDAFCVYHYWFDGRRLLEQPLDRLLERPEIDFPFYLCWANESWRRNWDGLSGEVLMPQSYAPGFAAACARDVARYMHDPRYQRVDGTRPRFVIYRPDDMPRPEAAVEEMRRTWREEGLGEVELGAVLFHVEGESPVPEGLFDFWVEMPPHGLVGREAYLCGGPGGNRMHAAVTPGFRGLAYDYTSVARRSVSADYMKALPRNTIAGVMPSWDNTARRGTAAHIAYGANPGTFRAWLSALSRTRLTRSYRGELWINAWNEWAEKAMLEPCQQYGSSALEVLAEFCAAPESAGS
ncbi:lipopolysaccharide biosynthesis protein-like protein [Celeribacter indicus]|uniref:Lipopolysaccharide biosynthesis protein-like protein n=2 Tax=Celeribacter indicus TaxID=1208324 RepID=A0A0B5DM39_9RHOB|nr:glycoside hydrolase family 99-like domain-containing protein [Celeribacter indicus]AJE44728.1 lipopolysaccharide biosynthesis protein-like protein [Celeribacter indicus]